MFALKQSLLRDPLLSKLAEFAKRDRVPLFLVGGYLRDLLIGVHRKDYDFALPKEFSSLIPLMEHVLGLHFFEVGKGETKTYRITTKDLSIDLTYLQGRTIEEDLSRRDFTMNAIAFSLKDDTFHWVEGAREDVEKKVIRLVSSEALDKDPLRMLRAIRYLATLEGFRLDPTLLDEIRRKKDQLQKIPGERLKMEMDHILFSPRRYEGLLALQESGLLLVLFPEMRGLEGLGQGRYHHLDTLYHTLLTVKKLSWALDWCSSKHHEIPLTPERHLVLSYAALFHDLGKTQTYQVDERGQVHFYRHETFSGHAAEKIMERLKFSRAMREQVLRLIQHHMRILNLSHETKETALKRLVHQVGDETPLLVLLTLADKEASRGVLSFPRDEVVETQCLKILNFYGERNIAHPLPLVTGDDVIALGYSQGPRVGEILRYLRDKQIMGEIHTREEALRCLKEEFSFPTNELRTIERPEKKLKNG